jgi:dTDP-4-amino-4,6-dideoxygalactose transaminase
MSEPDPQDNLMPFNRASLTGREFDYMARALDRMHVSGDGSFSKSCHTMLESLLGVKRAMLTTSCTHALEMAAILLDLKPGDEVIVPSFTFVSTANAFALRGAKIVFADIRRDTLNIDETKLPALITPQTKAVVVVHYAGVGCEMDAILSLCNSKKIPVVEDNAHGLFGEYRGKKLGTLGQIAALSFHETKNITCGEGGAILLNDPALIERAEIIREKGTNRARFFRGQVDKYSWVDIGSSYLPSDLLAAFLLAQLESGEQIQTQRRTVWTNYHHGLQNWAEKTGVHQPIIPAHCASAWHMYHLILPTPQAQQGLIQHLKDAGILAVFHYQPLHLSEMGKRFSGASADCPVTEWVSPRLLRLPFFNSLTLDDQNKVIDVVNDFSF